LSIQPAYVLCDWGSSDFGGEDYDDDPDCEADGGTVVTDTTTVTVNGDDSGDLLETLQDGGDSSFIEYQEFSGDDPNKAQKTKAQQCNAAINSIPGAKVVQFFSLYNLATNFKSAWKDWTHCARAQIPVPRRHKRGE
jgi:hypothetical protein